MRTGDRQALCHPNETKTYPLIRTLGVPSTYKDLQYVLRGTGLYQF